MGAAKARDWIRKLLRPASRSLTSSKPRGLRCQFETLEDRLAPATLSVDTTSDVADGATTSITALLANKGADGRISLREAILAANNTSGTDTIQFSIPGNGPYAIAPTSALPTITGAVTIDGTTQPGYVSTPVVELRGDSAGSGVNGLTFSAGGNVIKGLIVNRFGGAGIALNGSTGSSVLSNFIGVGANGTETNLGNGGAGISIGSGGTSSSNVIGNVTGQGNVIAANGGVGVAVVAGTGNSIRGNSIVGNGGLGIDLFPAGVTADDSLDTDTGANNLQNFPVLSYARPGSSTRVVGLFNSGAGSTYNLDFYASASPDASGNGEGKRYLGSYSGTTQGQTGNLSFDTLLSGASSPGEWITATATDASNNTSEFSVAVKANSLAPTPLISGSSLALKDATYTLSLSASDPDGVAITSWSINWGDGVTDVLSGNPSTATHSYSQAGSPNITATATDSEGTYTAYVKTQGSSAVPLPLGAISWWKGENNGLDSVGTNNLSLLNGTTFTSSKVGQGFSFDGIDDRAQGTDNDSIKVASMTIEGWIKTSGFTSGIHNEILFRGDDRSQLDPYFLSLESNNQLDFGIYDQNANISELFVPITLNQLLYVAATYDQATGVQSIYINGVLAGTKTSTIRVLYDLSPTSIPEFGVGNSGGYPGTVFNFPFRGQIDELALYGRPLSQAEIQAIYNADSAGKFQPTVTSLSVGVLTSGSVPAVTGVSPATGSTSGANSVVITGSNFAAVTGVFFGATAATSYVVNSTSQITAVVPAHVAGAVDVTVANALATSATSAQDQYTYVAGLPSLTSISPTSGSTAGGTTVTITGTNLLGATAVKFGTVAGTIVTNTATQITVTSPAFGSGGTVDVTVTTAGGTTAIVAADQFTYNLPPSITSLSPNTGTTSGGFGVVIVGANFTGATAVTFGGTAATSFTVNSSTQITAVAPSRSAGAVDVRVTTPTGQSAVVAGDQFTYVAPGSPQTVVVDTISDTVDGTTTSITALLANKGADGRISLREAILAANNSINTGADTIQINIPGSGTHTIAPTSALPTITDSVNIDGTVQTGYAGAPIIELRGDSAGAGVSGLTFTSGGNTIKGLIVNRFAANGIVLNGSTASNVLSNYVGVGVAGTETNLGNGGVGILVGSGSSSSSNVVGNVSGQGNVIAFNGGAGVSIVAGTNNSIRGNSIFSNGGLGIDLGSAGVTANDNLDADTGPNNLQNFPVLSASRPGSTTRVVGVFNGIAGATVNLDFYASASPDGSGNGEGKRYLGSYSGTTQSPTGNFSFDTILSAATAANEWITATAVDSSGNTSEFSVAVKATSLPPTPMISGGNLALQGGTYTLNLSSTDPDGVAITSWTINWGDGVTDIVSGNPSTATHVYSQSGAPNISATATDPEGTYTAYVKTTGAAAVPLPTGAVSWWKGENNGNDSVGTNNLTLVNGTSFAPGKVGTGFSFDGIDDRAQSVDTDSVRLASLTIEGWINTSGFTSGIHNEIFFRGDDRSQLDPYFLSLESSNQLDFGLYDQNANISELFVPVTLNQLLHVAATYDQATGVQSIYVNGVLAGTKTTTIRVMYDLSTSNNSEFGVGNSGGQPGTPFNFPFRGQIDELALYGRALSQTEIQSIVAADSAGKFALNVTNLSVNVVAANGLPTVASVNPASGTSSGGTSVVIAGANFLAISGVSFGGTPATSFTVNSTSQITAVTPLHAPGAVDVTVTNPLATSATSAADRYTYVAVPPAITSLSPTSGSSGGTTTVTITGTDLGGATSVKFGAIAGNILTNTTTQITVMAPANSAGVVDVIVTTAAGTSAIVAADRYTYNTLPAVTSLSPSSGSTSGGYAVVITGANFTNVASVTFGGSSANSYTVNSATQITAVVPSHSAGAVDVRVSTSVGQSALHAADSFSYVTPGAGQTVTVDTVSDVVDGYVSSITALLANKGPDGRISLREAILAANNSANTSADLIKINIPGSGAHTIATTSALPTITDAVTIDGTAQLGYVSAPLIEIRGDAAGAGASGLTFSVGGNVVKGLVIDRFAGNGIVLNGSTSSSILSNYLGVGLNGNETNVGNGGAGILINSSSNVIGNVSGQANVIAFNGGAGVTVASGTGNTIRGNSIFSNVGLGIDLVPAGVTANDLGDGDTGANALQNFPVIAVARPGSSTRVAGTFNGANASITVDFYASASPDSTGNGEGKRYLGSYSAATISTTGNLSFDTLLTAATTAGEWITATATDPSGNTSEFSVAVKASSLAPTAVISGPSTSAPGAPYTLNLSVTDPDGLAVTGWTINWGDGVIDTLSGTPSTATHTYSQSGGPAISATVVDPEGTYNAYVKTAAAAAVPLPVGAVSWWKGDGNGNDVLGVNNLTTVNGTAFVAGKVGQEFSFDGVDDRAYGADNASVKLASLTIEGWINVTGFPTALHGAIFFRGDDRSGFDPYYLATGSGGTLDFGIYEQNNTFSLLQVPIATNQLMHVAATYDQAAGAMTLYVNGAVVGTKSSTTKVLYDLSSSQFPGIGVGNSGGYPNTTVNYPFKGQIDELALYGRALSQAEIQAIVAADSAGKFALNATTLPVSVNEAPAIVSANAATFNGGLANTFNVVATGYPASTFSVTGGTLPAGVTLSSAGVLSGTPTVLGSFPVTLRASNGIGTAATQSFTLTVRDVTPPTVTLLTKPTPTSNVASPVFTFSGSDPAPGSLDHFETRVDNGAFVTATSPQTLTGITQGSHTFDVRSVDAAGNVSTPIRYSWNVDLTGPTVTVTSRPPALTNNAIASFTFTGSDPVIGGYASGLNHFEASLDGAPFAPTSSGVTLSVAGGAHVYRIHAVDNLGNVGADATASWTVDLVAPKILSVTPTNPAATVTNANSLTYVVTFDEPVAGVSVNDFFLMPPPGAALTGTIASVTPTSSSVYSVTIANVVGNGTLRLSVRNNQTIHDPAGNFFAPVDYLDGAAGNLGEAPESLAVGDFNGDNKLDVATVNSTRNSVSVLLGNGDGAFKPRTTYFVGFYPDSVATADVDGDGRLDLVTANQAGGLGNILRGNGDGSFIPQTTFATPAGAVRVTLADLNRDGKPDIVMNDSAGNAVSILLNNGSGGFLPRVTFAAGAAPDRVAVGDVNGDGKPDVVATNYFANKISVLLNNGDGSFKSPQAIDVGFGPLELALGDLDGNGSLDVVAGGTSNVAAVLLANGDGSFKPKSTFATQNDAPTALAIGDLDGDGKPDLAIRENYSDFLLYLGNGNGTFQSPTDHGGDTASSVAALAIADVNGDNVPDVLSSSDAAGLRVFLGNRTYYPSYSIDQSAPTAAILTSPPANANSASAAFTFSATDPAVNGYASGIDRIEINLDGKGYVTAAGSASYSGLAEGGHVFQLRALDKAGNVSAVVSYSWKVDLTGPLALSIDRGSPAATSSASSVIYVVTFNEPVLHVDAADFKVVTTGTAAYSTLQVAGSGATYLVTIGGIQGGGQLGLNLVDNHTISDLAGNALANFLSAAAFETRQTFASPSAANATTADVDGDGNADVIEVNGGNVVTVLRGGGDGSVGESQTYAVGAMPVAVVAADVDADGKTDLIVVNRNGAGISLLIGNGNGTFKTQQTFGAGARPAAAAFGDVNGDGKTDVVVVNLMNNSASVLLGNANGTFQSARTFTTGALPDAIAIGDVNGDGKLDLVVANQGSQSVSVLLGNGDGNFQQQKSYTVGSLPSSLALVDVNGDAILDAVVANKGSNSVSVLIGLGNGAFKPQTTFAVGSLPKSVAVGDVSGDGAVDIVVANSGGGSVSVLRGNGDGTFNLQETFAAGASPNSVTLSDLDGDGKSDILVTSDNGAGSILISAAAGSSIGQPYTIDHNAPSSGDSSTAGLAPSVTGIAGNAQVTGVVPFVGPTSGGTTVIISGVNFLGVTAVRFGGVDATSYTVNSATQITAIAPPGHSGLVDVTVTNLAGVSSTASSLDDYTYATPSVVSVVVNGGAIAARDRFGKAPNLAAQSSVVTQILVTFNQRVTLEAGALAVNAVSAAVSALGAAPSSASVAVQAAGVSGTGDEVVGYSQYLLTFLPGDGVNSFDNTASGGSAFTSLQDGAWQLITTGAKVHAGGDTGSDRADAIWSLFGVANPGDVKSTLGLADTLLVDGLALQDTYAAFGSRNDHEGSAYRAAFDWNLDGAIDGIDLSHLYLNFGTIWRM